MTTTHIMNSATMPAPGRYEARRVSREEWAEMARKALAAGNWKSSVGFQQDAGLIHDLTGYAIPLDFSPTVLQHGDRMLIMRLPYRVDDKGQEVPAEDFEYYAATYQATGLQASAPTFGKALQAYLKAAGVTQRELARRIGAGQGHVSRYASGAAQPTAGKIEGIGSALGCEISYCAGRWRFTEVIQP